MYTLKELINGEIRDAIDDEDANRVPDDPSSVIVRTELPLVESLPINRSVEIGGGSATEQTLEPEASIAEIDQPSAPGDGGHSSAEVTIVPPADADIPNAEINVVVPPSDDTPLAATS